MNTHLSDGSGPSELQPPPPPPPTHRGSRTAGSHSTRKLIAAAGAGLVLGASALTLVWSSPIQGVASPPPGAVGSDAATTEPPVATPPAPSGDLVADPAQTGVEQAVAEQAALAYLGAGRVTWVSPEDDRGAAWEIEVTLPNGREVDVLVDASGQVITARQGLARWLP